VVGRHLLVAAIALGAALCFAASNVIEQRKAALAPPKTSMRIALFWYLARQPVWWLGIGVDVGGFTLQVLAVGLGALVFVQPLLVTSLLFALVLAAVVGDLRLSVLDLVWALLFMGSLSAFLVAAAPSGGVDTRGLGAWVVPLLVIGVLVLGALSFGRRARPTYRATAFAAAAGLLFGISSTLMKGFASEIDHDGVVGMLGHWEPYAMALVLATGFLFLQSAFQASDLRAALPLLEVSEPLVACLLGLALLHERLHADDLPTKILVAASIVLMGISAVALARSTAQAHRTDVVDLRDPAEPARTVEVNPLAGRDAATDSSGRAASPTEGQVTDRIS
jgi:drug/metabolite transporter (DMT)-like permease